MALYNLEITEPISNPKTIALVCGLAHLTRTEAKRRLQHLPMMVQASVPLADAVGMQRQLRKAGISARLTKTEVSVEDGQEQDSAIFVSSQPSDEVIEIPDEDIRILEPIEEVHQTESVKKRRISRTGRRRNLLLILGSVVLIVAGYWFFEIRARQGGLLTEVNSAIENWSRTLNNQEALLDQGITPQQIYAKLLDIEHKLERLLAMIKSAEQRQKEEEAFTTLRQREGDALLDLDFRRKLETAGYFLHPTCLVDQGLVRGSSDLPTGTRLRIQLFGSGGLEPISYAAQIRDGFFRLALDPSIEGGVYDARATVAAFSQQPAVVQEWAAQEMSLTVSPQLALTWQSGDNGRFSEALTRDRHAAMPMGTSALAPSYSAEMASLAGGASDSAISHTLQATLDEWETTLQEAREDSGKKNLRFLEDIYQKLLQLEAKIDQLLHLLQSQDYQDSCLTMRNGLYGSYRSLRHELGQRHEQFLNENSPFFLEEKIRHALQNRGLAAAEVLVLDSPHQTDAFVIEIENLGKGWQNEDSLAIVVEVLAAELSRAPFRVEAIKYQDENGTRRWTPALIDKAAFALHEEGCQRCLKVLNEGHN